MGKLKGDQLVKELRQGLEFARKGARFRELGSLSSLTSLQSLSRAKKEFPDYGTVDLGRRVKRLLWEGIDGLRPSSREDLNDDRWRIYLLLRDHVQRGKEWQQVAEVLRISQTTFGDLKRRAGEALAASILDREERMFEPIKSNLGPPPFEGPFVERHNWNDEEQTPIITPGYSMNDSLAEIVIAQVGGTQDHFLGRPRRDRENRFGV